MELVNFDDPRDVEPPKSPPPTQELPTPTRKNHSLWLFYSKQDELLYVSMKPNSAIITRTEWWPNVNYCKIKHFTSKDDLEEAKLIAVQDEDAKWNSHGKRTDLD